MATTKRMKRAIQVAKKRKAKKHLIKVAVHHPKRPDPVLEVVVHDPSFLERATAWVKTFGD
jgi:hypothetical protein